MNWMTYSRQDRKSGIAVLRNDSVLRRISLVLILGVTIPLFTVNLSTWPATWFDEGLNLSTAATLSSSGTYGLPDSSGVRVMDPAIQTGPVVVAPVALAFDVFGASITNARAVMVLLALLALVSFYILARYLGGTRAALIGVFLLLVGSGDVYTSFVPLGRQMLGEVPAFGLFCLGCWIWARGVDGSISPGRASVLAGIALGLTMITKSQFALTLPVALGVVWIVDRLYYRSSKIWSLPLVAITAVGCVLIWYVTQVSITGIEAFRANSAVLREGFTIHVARFSVQGTRSALETLFRTGFVVWGLPGVLYGFWLCRERGSRGLVQALPLALACIWLGWYIFLSIGWGRYAAIPLMVCTIYSARLLADVSTGALRIHPTLDRYRLQAVVVVSVAMLLAFGGTLGSGVFGRQDTGAQDLAQYLQREVPSSAVIETWTWELDIAAPQRFRHPETPVTNAYTLALWTGQPLPPGIYDPAAANPDYVIDGPFSRWTGIYADYLAKHTTEIARFGDYALYEVHQAAR